jgi:hypothetical protein
VLLGHCTPPATIQHSDLVPGIQFCDSFGPQIQVVMPTICGYLMKITGIWLYGVPERDRKLNLAIPYDEYEDEEEQEEKTNKIAARSFKEHPAG